jgi:hypothetical protein
MLFLGHVDEQSGVWSRTQGPQSCDGYERDLGGSAGSTKFHLEMKLRGRLGTASETRYSFPKMGCQRKWLNLVSNYAIVIAAYTVSGVNKQTVPKIMYASTAIRIVAIPDDVAAQADDKVCPHQTLAWQLSLSTVLNLNLHPTSLID